MIRSMSLLCLRIDDESGPLRERGYVERNAISLLTTSDARALDPPSHAWLGRHAPSPKSGHLASGTSITSMKLSKRGSWIGSRRWFGRQADVRCVIQCANSKREGAGTFVTAEAERLGNSPEPP